MQYTTRTADKPGEAHVNYQCPCGCVAGLMYDQESGSMHLGQCCCGRLLWLGTDAVSVVQANLDTSSRYEVEEDDVTLPWGDVVRAALAVPAGAAMSPAEKQGYHVHDDGSVHKDHVEEPVHTHDEHDHRHHQGHDHHNHDHGEKRRGGILGWLFARK